ncbi:hypothetical protein DEDE109153_08800 [Deinococcus deserti]
MTDDGISQIAVQDAMCARWRISWSRKCDPFEEFG